MKVVLENLTKVFTDKNDRTKKVVAVNHFSFEIPDGKLVALLGPSGCGKSTTLNLICGLEKPTEGRIWFGDTDVTEIPPEDRGVGLVFQSYALYPHMTVKRNIMFPLENLRGANKPTKAQMEERALEAAKLVQIEHLMNRRPAELSGGQQQRVAIARALVKMPGVLLLDEPLSNLDARLRLQTREEIRRIQQETGITTIFVTHDQEEAMSISDFIIVMEAGSLRQMGEPQQVYDEPANLFVAKFLGTPQINVFDGEVRGGKVFIGEEAVALAPGLEDRDVAVAIRPEGLLPDPEGCLGCGLKAVGVMGRDTSVEATHPKSQQPTVRAIIDSMSAPDKTQKEVRFSIRERKLFLFDPESGERLGPVEVLSGGEMQAAKGTRAGGLRPAGGGNSDAQKTGTGAGLSRDEQESR